QHRACRTRQADNADRRAAARRARPWAARLRRRRARLRPARDARARGRAHRRRPRVPGQPRVAQVGVASSPRCRALPCYHPRMEPTAELVAERGVLQPRGAWVLATLDPAPPRAPRATPASALDCSGLTALDTAGALAIWRLASDHGLEPAGLRAEFAALYQQVATLAARPVHRAPPAPGILHRIGVRALDGVHEAQRFLAFTGELATTALGVLARPSRLRWKPMLSVFETAGWGALPILGLLSFLIGVVIAYQAGIQLRDFGANIFIADLI